MIGNRLVGMRGKVQLRITGACPEDCLYRMILHGVRFRNYDKKDELTAELVVSAADMDRVNACAKKTMCDVKMLRTFGLIPMLWSMKLRLIYPLILCCLIAAVFWIQGRILFFKVEGNTTIPEQQILQILESGGISFWTRGDSLDLNMEKNKLLAQIPELGWITINTEGPTAAVVVRQREEKPVTAGNYAPANVVAEKSGIIEAVTVTGGTPQVNVGDVVIAGDLLISGVTNLDKTMLLTRAEGEITARTYQRKTGMILKTVTEKSYTGRESRKISLTFGKNTINFYNSGRISYDNYDKMYDRKALTLPGGYVLPLSITVITFREYDTVEVPVAEDDAQQLLEDSIRKDTENKFHGGMILDMRLKMEDSAHYYILSGLVECREDIGRTVEIKE